MRLHSAAQRICVAQAEMLAALVGVARESPEPEFVSMEVCAALAWTRQRASVQLELAQALVVRLPAVHKALAGAAIDLERARVFAEAVAALDVAAARAVCAQALPRAGSLTTGQLRALLAKLVIEADPDAAAVRHRQRVCGRRCVVEPGPDSTADLCLYDLPADRAVAAADRVHVLAAARKRGGDARSMDQLRADTAVDLLLGHIGAAAAAASSGAASSGAASSGAASGEGGVSGRAAGFGEPSRATGSGGAFPVAGGNAGGTAGGTVDIVVPLATLAGLADDPGLLNGYGPVIADIARQVAALQRRSTWTFTAYDTDTGQVFTGLTRRRPSAALARHIRLRDRTCRFPGCRIPARRCDLDHTVAVKHGGLTHAGGLGPGCRFHHRGKHQGGWKLEQPRPGHSIWHSPLGRTYNVLPELPLDDSLGREPFGERGKPDA